MPKKNMMLMAVAAGTVAACSFMAWFVISNYCFSFTVPPYAMEPSIYPGEKVLVDRTAYRSAPPRRGDVVVYRYPAAPTKLFIHRIVAFPGESVELKDHKLLINGVKITEDWALKVRYYNSGKLAKRGMKPFVVPEGHYYVLGDNAARSEDSRAWGALPRENLIGRAYRIYHPFKRSGPVK